LHERQAWDMHAAQSLQESPWTELQPVLDEELNQLPEKYRAPLVLCCLQGKTHQQAAHELGWPSGSMSRRMARARQLLQKRLTRRGVTLASVLLFLELSRPPAPAAVPPTLVNSTVKAAVLFRAGKTVATGAISLRVMTLAAAMIQNLVLAKVRATLVTLL